MLQDLAFPGLASSIVAGLVTAGAALAAGRAALVRGATGLRLLISETGWPCLLTIGHANRPLHRKTFFALAGPAAIR